MSKILNIFRKKKFKDYRTSTHVELYESLAKEFDSTAQYVYELAHGRESITEKDLAIREALIEAGIIYRYGM